MAFPSDSFTMRVVGMTANLIHPDFSATGKAADVNWAKIWDPSIAEGKVVGTSTTKVGKIAPDSPNSELFAWEGSLQVIYEGRILKISGELNAVKR